MEEERPNEMEVATEKNEKRKKKETCKIKAKALNISWFLILFVIKMQEDKCV